MLLICKFLNEMKLNLNKEALKIPLVIFCLFDADLLLVWINNFRHGLDFRSTNNFAREHFYITLAQRYFCASIIYNKAVPLSALQIIMYSNPTFLKLRCGVVVIKNSKTCKGCHFHAIKGHRPNLYAVLLPSHYHAEPNAFCCFSSESNRLDLVRHGSSTAVA